MAKLPDLGPAQLKTAFVPARGSGLPPGIYTDSESFAIECANQKARETGEIHFVYKSSHRRPAYAYRIVSRLWPSLNFEKAVFVTKGEAPASMTLDAVSLKLLNEALIQLKVAKQWSEYANACMAIVDAMGGKDNAEPVIRELIRLAGLGSQEVSISTLHSMSERTDQRLHGSGQTLQRQED